MKFLIHMGLVFGLAVTSFAQEEKRVANPEKLVEALGTIATGRVKLDVLNQAYGLRKTAPTPAVEAAVVRSCAAGLIFLGDKKRYQSIRPALPNAELFEHGLVDPCTTCAGGGKLLEPCAKCSGRKTNVADPFGGGGFGTPGTALGGGLKGHGKCTSRGCVGGKVAHSSALGRGARVVNCPGCRGTGNCMGCQGKGELHVICKTCGATGKLSPKKNAYEQSVAFAKAGLELIRTYRKDVDEVAHQQALKAAELDAVRKSMANKSTVAGAKEYARLRVQVEKDDKYSDVDEKITKSIVIIEGDRGRGTGFLCDYLGKKVVLSNVHVFCGNRTAKLQTIYDGPVEPAAIWVCKDRDIIYYEVKDPEKYSYLKVYDWKKSVPTNDEIIVMGNSAGGGVVTSLRGKLNGVGPDRIEVDAVFVSGNSGSPIISYGQGAQVIGIATYATFDPQIDWVQKDTRFSEVRRFGLRFEDLEPSDFVRLDGKKYMAGLKATEDLHDFAILTFEHALKSVVLNRGLVSLDNYQPTEKVKARAKELHRNYEQLPQWQREHSSDAELGIAILQAVGVLPE